MNENLEEHWNKLKLNMEYPSYENREKIKNLAWKIINKCIEEKKYYKSSFLLLHGVIWSDYWRARENIEGRKNTKSCLNRMC